MHAPLPRGEVVARVADGGDDGPRPRQPGDGDGEDVGVEAEGVDHVDAVAAQVGAEAELLAQRPRAVQGPDPILGERPAAPLDLAQEVAPALEAGHVQVEPGAVEAVGQVDDLPLRAAGGEDGEELEDPHRVRTARVLSPWIPGVHQGWTPTPHA